MSQKDFGESIRFGALIDSNSPARILTRNLGKSIAVRYNTSSKYLQMDQDDFTTCFKQSRFISSCESFVSENSLKKGEYFQC